jgi:hypothetical protein
MKVVEKQPKQIRVSDITPGDLFRVIGGSSIYMKINNTNNTCIYNALSVITGNLCCLKDDHTVIPIEGEFVEK